VSINVWVEGDPNHETAGDFNVSNDNWMRLLSLIGADDLTLWAGSLCGGGLADFRCKVVFALETVRRMPELDSGTPSRHIGNIVEAGLPEGYYQMRLTALLALVDRALRRGTALLWA
jgi:hypothetical protein